MECPKCGFTNPKDSKFCNQCGSSLDISQDKRLEMVKTNLPETMKDKILTAKIEGERKNVTVIFADVSGFTELSEKLDPEEITDIINKLFKVLIRVVYEYEGTIDKLIGDCIMALFGAPITHEDDPERAVHSALGIIKALDRFNEEQGISLSIHIGINTGLVIVGGVGSDLKMEYTVMGDTVNLAERLMETAKDEILVSESVYKKVSYLFEMTKLKPVSLKGKAEKVTPYRVIAKKKTPTSKRGIPGLYSPLVGRQKEMEILQSTVKKLIKGNGSVVSIIGETGVGKSRLIQEIKDFCRDKVEWLNGRAFSYGKHLPFKIIQELLRSYMDINEFDYESEAQQKLKKKIQTIFKDTIDEYYPYLCQFLSMEVPAHLQEKIKYLDPEPLKLQAAVSVKALFREIAKRKPLVLYFEDMHLIDPESLELLKFLLDGLSSEPVLFIFESRPEKDTGLYVIHPFIKKKFKDEYTELILKPLDTTEVKQLIQNLLKFPGFPQDISNLILDKSEGNPFYIEEIIETFIDVGILKMKKDTWQVASDISLFTVPDNVEAAIRARIDKLPLEAKEMLGKASVIGRNFLSKILSCITDGSQVDTVLKVLVERQFIMIKDEKQKKQKQEEEYIFKHTLTRDICYKGLLKKKRRNVHQRVAQCVEKIHKGKLEDYFDILAMHYDNAENFEKSYYYYKKAGDTEKKLYRHDSAIEWYSKALEMHVELFKDKEKGKHAELFENRGDSYEIKAEYDNALKDFENSFSLYEDHNKKARIKRKIGNIYHNKSEYDTAISHYEKAIEMLKTEPDSPLLLETLIDYAWLLSQERSNYEKAQKTIEMALSKLNKNKEPQIHAHGLNTLGNVFFRQGNHDKALEHRRKALDIHEKLNDKRGIADGFTNVGAVYYRQGELEKALYYYKRSLEITEEIGYKLGIASACRNIGLVYRVKGDSDTALLYYKRCLSISEEIGHKSGIAAVYYNLGHMYVSGNLETALEYYKQCLSISEEIGNKSGIGQVSNNIGIVYKNKGELDTALKYYERYLSIAEELGDKWGKGLSSGNISYIYYEKGNLDKALEFGNQSLDLFEKIGYKAGIGIAAQIIGHIFKEKGENEEALKYYQRHLSIYEDMGIKRELRRAYLNMGNFYAEERNLDEARKYIEKAEKFPPQVTGNIDLSEMYITLSSYNIAIGEIKSATDFAEKAFFLAKDTGTKINEIVALRSIGLALSKENPETAQSYLEESTTLAKSLNIKLEEGKSLFELSKLFISTGKGKKAERFVKEAEKIFIKANATGWIKRIGKLKKGND
jgi:class 3 adenylate cyclase/predicted ATPase